MVRVGDDTAAGTVKVAVSGELGRFSAGLRPVGDGGLAGCSGDIRSVGDLVSGDCSGP